jgi:hypothetical protein
MNQTSADIVVAFNDCITRRDIGGLSQLMTEDHVFIDSANNTISGKGRCVGTWTGFFAAFPDYRNHFERVLLVGQGLSSSATLPAPTCVWQAPHYGPRR